MNCLNIFRKTILLCGILLIIGILIYLFRLIILYASDDIKIVSAYIVFLISAITMAVIFHKLKFLQNSLWIYVCLVILSFAFQITLSSQVSFNGETDLQFYFLTATDLASNNISNSKHLLYYATFPGTITYPAVLSVFMNLFGVSRMIPVLLNHFVICALVCLVYSFLKRRMSMIWALSGSLLLALHPFIIIYSNTCNAELIFGALMLFAFFAFEKSRISVKMKSQLVWVSITALLCGISQLFRPLAMIMIIALVLYILLFNSDKLKNRLLFSSILIITFSLVGFTKNIIVKTITTYEPPSSSYGWNLYVGASPTGGWNEEDAKEFDRVSNSASSPTEIQEYFAAKAIERYKMIGFDILIRGFRKLEPWLSYEYMANETTWHDDGVSFPMKNSRGVTLALIALIDIPILFLALLAVVRISLKALKNYFEDILILVFYLIGSFLALMLLEVAPRYTVSYRMIFCIFSIYLLHAAWTNIAQRMKVGENLTK